MKQIVLETERLLLKAITPFVIQELFETRPDEEIKVYFGYDEIKFTRLKNIYEGGMETSDASFFYFVLLDKKSHLPIGECGFHTWNKKHLRAELFYNIHLDEFKNKGLMSESLETVLDFGFSELQLHRIVGMVAPYNEPSLKLLLKNGFFKEGTARQDYKVNGINEDSDCYSLLKWEWEKQNKSKTDKISI